MMTYFSDGNCEITAPVSQARARPAEKQQVAYAAEDGPASRKKAPRLPFQPQPVYLRECTGDYVLYVPPPSP